LHPEAGLYVVAAIAAGFWAVCGCVSPAYTLSFFIRARPRFVRGSMRRTASWTSRVGWRATACSAEYSRRPPGNSVWWMYFLSCHFLPVSRTFSAFTTTTKSPQSAWGVKVGLCLPRKTLAMVVATRPSTWSFTSMTTQLRWTVRLLPITVFIRALSKRAAFSTGSESGCQRSARGGLFPKTTGTCRKDEGLLLALRPQSVEAFLDARLLAGIARPIVFAALQPVRQILLRHIVSLEIVRI